MCKPRGLVLGVYCHVDLTEGREGATRQRQVCFSPTTSVPGVLLPQGNMTARTLQTMRHHKKRTMARLKALLCFAMPHTGLHCFGIGRFMDLNLIATPLGPFFSLTLRKRSRCLRHLSKAEVKQAIRCRCGFI